MADWAWPASAESKTKAARREDGRLGVAFVGFDQAFTGSGAGEAGEADLLNVR
jgi:hypothetical protein